MESLLFFAVLSAASLWAWSAQGIREIALRATIDYCASTEVQLLDQNVSLRGLWFKRDQQGKLRVWRAYNFEFSSTGDERYQGRTVLLGRIVQNISLAPHRFLH